MYDDEQPANQFVPFHVTLRTSVAEKLAEFEGYHVIPSYEYASLLDASPPATHNNPFQATE